MHADGTRTKPSTGNCEQTTVNDAGGGAARVKGRQAEDRIARHLRWRGWRICARNWIGGGGELDIVASRWTTLLVVEVRARATAEQAWASIDEAKLGRTRRAARAMVRQHGLHRYRLRIDLYAVDDAGRISCKRDILP